MRSHPQGRRTAKTTITAGESIHTQTYQWNSLDQLTSATAQTGGQVSFTYDAQGRLARAATGAFTRTFNYALSDSPVRTASALTGIGAVTRQEQSLYGPPGLIEERANDAAPTYPQLDGQGTILSRVQESGKALDAPELDPWGVPVEPDQQAPNLMGQKSTGFLGGAGRIDIPGSELTKLGARYYDAESGGFVSTDPVVGDAGEPVRRVSYLYAGSNPAAFSDLDGASFVSAVKGAPGAALRWGKGQAERISIDLGRISSDPNSSGLERFSANFWGALTSLASSETFNTTALALLESAVPVGRAIRVLSLAPREIGAAGKVAEATEPWWKRIKRVGDPGENAVRGKYNIGPKPGKPIEMNGNPRIPDGMTKGSLSEVKNVNYQSWTQQLEDYAVYAQKTDRTFYLYLKNPKAISSGVKAAAKAGRVVIRSIP